MLRIFRKRKPKVLEHSPKETLDKLKNQIGQGRRPSLETLTRDELAAAQTLITQGQAKIDQVNCRAFLVAVLKP